MIHHNWQRTYMWHVVEFHIRILDNDPVFSLRCLRSNATKERTLNAIEIRRGPSTKKLLKSLSDSSLTNQRSVHFVLFDQDRQCTFERDLRILTITRSDVSDQFEITGYLDHDLTSPISIIVDWTKKVLVKGIYNRKTRQGQLDLTPWSKTPRERKRLGKILAEAFFYLINDYNAEAIAESFAKKRYPTAKNEKINTKAPSQCVAWISQNFLLSIFCFFVSLRFMSLRNPRSGLQYFDSIANFLHIDPIWYPQHLWKCLLTRIRKRQTSSERS